MTDETRFADETDGVAVALAHLLDTMADRLPELAPALHDCRVVLDTRELALLVCPIQPDGSSAPLFVLRCDPHDPETFGRLAVPVPVRGAYGRPEQMH